MESKSILIKYSFLTKPPNWKVKLGAAKGETTHHLNELSYCVSQSQYDTVVPGLDEASMLLYLG